MIRTGLPEVKPFGLETSLQYLKGVGPQRSVLFRRLGLKTLRDLLYHFPRRYEDRRTFGPITGLTPGQKSTVRGRVAGASIFRARTGTVILQVVVKDSTGTVTALWFNQPYMRKWFPPGQELVLYGMVERVGRRFQIAAPEFELVQAGAAEHRSLHMGRIVPIYPATSGLHQRELRSAVAQALRALLPTLKDPLPADLLGRHSLLDYPTALKRIHFPPVPEAAAASQARLAFDELLCFQIALGLRRRKLSQRPGIVHQTSGDLVTRWKGSLPFKLTAGQEQAIQEISKDMEAEHPMHRLVQGEVGSGKTAVAAYAVVVAVQSGFQAVVMAPTEVLARQHALTLTQLLASVDLPAALLTSSLDESSRRELAQGLSVGTVPLLVATHAVLEPWVKFSRLGLVVIDEQQKFGVDQRKGITAKGNNPDLLILTATPIPRTLALTLYGEMEISTITERPAGRQPVRTVWMDSTRREESYAFVKTELDAGRQAYVVCPRIGPGERRGVGFSGPLDNPSEVVSLKAGPRSLRRNDSLQAENRARSGHLLPSNPIPAPLTPSPEPLIPFPEAKVASAQEIFREYQQIFAGYRVGLLHGRMNAREQRAIFSAFKAGEIQVLVATQIIEVGVDVANATVMVIEGAERFGLAQLHQLRGRVGRGKHEATCILMADPKDPSSVDRLQTLVEVADAFKIAEEDLRLRGPGELLGKRQSGLPDLKCLEWATHGPWPEISKVEAESILSRNSDLSSPEIAGLMSEIDIRFQKLLEPCE
ncbi:MAG: ATP-dependent DNA helicase RecG [Candidatus Omnitrophica bacterium]|nr:ATP-dependent DNA helicase RecG [Candidatus Omnitrophota bacterium]